MAKYHHTEGICLRRIDYSNTSQVASFLTPDVGRLSVMAKGVTRAPKRGVRTGFDLLARYELIYTERPGGALQNLTQQWLRESFRGFQESLDRALCGYYAADLILNFTAEGEPCPGLYALMLQVLRRLASGQALGANVLVAELAVLREHGSSPRFDACAACGRDLPERGAVLFSPADGGPLCRDCEKELRPGLRKRTTPAGADLLRGLSVLDAYVRERMHRPHEALPTPPVTEQAPAMSALLRFHMRDLLGKELRLWPYFERRLLSRSLAALHRRAGRA